MDRRGHWHEHVALHRTAVVAAQRLGDIHRQATALRLLGETCTRIGDFDEAEHHLGHLSSAASCYQHAVSIFHELSDQYLEAAVLDTSATPAVTQRNQNGHWSPGSRR